MRCYSKCFVTPEDLTEYEENRILLKVIEARKSNPSIQSYLDKAKAIYYLSREYNAD
jgi:hypothetical protein